ncbi:MAG: class I SAM-dependent methyltransferase [Bacteroidota bacterium]|nr:class I SAM-dependent methyltransferase [Bacteroidota bacterium]
MNNQQAYNKWAEQYDTNQNKTRDLEGISFRKTLNNYFFSEALEIGCGTGKNSEWLVTKAAHVVAVDFSEEMLAKAKTKVAAPNIEFKQADITKDWDFADTTYDLISFSLVLEHIENLHFIFEQVRNEISIGGFLYIGELHPYKQYAGSVARFETEGDVQRLECYPHHLSEFFKYATAFNFSLVDFNEWFDEENKKGVPRIVTLLFKAL